jgi:hypothetical protein
MMREEGTPYNGTVSLRYTPTGEATWEIACLGVNLARYNCWTGQPKGRGQNDDITLLAIDFKTKNED